MAAVDKIYGNQQQWFELVNWLICEGKYAALKSIYCRCETNPEKNAPISNFSTAFDRWLWDKCPLPFVKEALTEQYDGSPYKEKVPHGTLGE